MLKEGDVKFFVDQVAGRKIIAVDKDEKPVCGFEDRYFVADGTYSQSPYNGFWLVHGVIHRISSGDREPENALYNNGFNFDNADSYRWKYLQEKVEIRSSACWCGKDKFGFSNHTFSCPCWKPFDLKE
jgi:hypothetical protein